MQVRSLEANQSQDLFLKSGEVSFARYKQETVAHKRTMFLKENMLLFVLQGHKNLHFNNFSITAKPGDLLFLKRGLYVMSEFIPEGLSYGALIIFCSNTFLKEFSLKHISVPPEIPVDTGIASYYLTIPSNRLLDSFSDQFLSYFDDPSFPYLEEIFKLKLQELFLLLISGSNRDHVIRWMRGVAHDTPLDIDYVVKTYLFQPFTLSELAKFAGRSLASFKRDFQHKYHTSPKKWINGQRLAHAKMLLNNTSQNISEVAAECGFENVPYFIRSFKQEFGDTPQAWRAKSATG
jgi:AraC-like DNA-binding protein